MQHIFKCYFKVKLKRKSPFLECFAYPKEQTKTNRQKIKPYTIENRKCVSLLSFLFCCCLHVERNEQQCLFHRRQTMALWLYLTQTPRTWRASAVDYPLSHTYIHTSTSTIVHFPSSLIFFFFIARFPTLFTAERIMLKPTATTTDQFTILRCTINTYLNFSLLLSECDFLILNLRIFVLSRWRNQTTCLCLLLEFCVLVFCISHLKWFFFKKKISYGEIVFWTIVKKKTKRNFLQNIYIAQLQLSE